MGSRVAKHLKLTIKNTQIAQAVNLGKVKEKLAKKGAETEAETPKTARAPSTRKAKTKEPVEEAKVIKEEAPPQRRARSKSVFAEGAKPVKEESPAEPESEPPLVEPTTPPSKLSTSEELRRKIFGEELEALASPEPTKIQWEEPEIQKEEPIVPPAPIVEPEEVIEEVAPPKPAPVLPPKARPAPLPYPPRQAPQQRVMPPKPDFVKLGPTGKHIKDLYPPKAPAPRHQPAPPPKVVQEKQSEKAYPRQATSHPSLEGKEEPKKGFGKGYKEFKDVKPRRADNAPRGARHGVVESEEEQRWRKKRGGKTRHQQEEQVIRPTTLKIRVPISIKDLAAEMKLKASQLISKLFMQGVIVTLNDLLDDETTILLLGQEFGCEITIDTSEEQRIRITDKTIKEEIAACSAEQLQLRPPVVAFMGHVDHGKTSLIDAIRKSNRAAGEAGAITQHIGAFRCHTAVGDITILDTPGHEAFSAMRARGADVTDIVVLVVAGDEGVRQQTLEAMQHAKTANVTIVVAINKSDKPNFNPDNVYRQLSENDLLPEVWGGQVLTVNCSAVTGAGIKELLEMLALQAEVMELKANPGMRARGVVLESEMHKGMGAVATVLVQNGTLKLGDALVFEHFWGHVKTMKDQNGQDLAEAPPSTPVAITGLSGLPEAGQEFIVVKNEREAREISEARVLGMRQSGLQTKKKLTAESLLEKATPTSKKMLNIILRADVQGSLEALKVALEKIHSEKAELNVISSSVGEISESDVQMAASSKGVIIGFHTRIESHAEALIKQFAVQVRLHDIIYHAIDDVKVIMTGLLDRIAQETDRGKVEVKALFKSSHAGAIAGCQVIEGTIQRNHHVRVVRQGEQIGKAQILSLRRNKDDVKEVAKGLECGVVLTKFNDIQVGDILETYEITYITQEL